MPVLDGYQTAVEIRNLEKKYGIQESEQQFIIGFSSEVRGLGKYFN